jgi:hypothetical protein
MILRGACTPALVVFRVCDEAVFLPENEIASPTSALQGRSVGSQKQHHLVFYHDPKRIPGSPAALLRSVCFVWVPLALAVDDMVIASVIDDSFSQGYIGLVGGVFDDTGLIVGFDNLTVHAP